MEFCYYYYCPTIPDEVVVIVAVVSVKKRLSIIPDEYVRYDAYNKSIDDNDGMTAVALESRGYYIADASGTTFLILFQIARTVVCAWIVLSIK